MAPGSGERTSTPRQTPKPQQKQPQPPIEAASRPLLPRTKSLKEKKKGKKKKQKAEEHFFLIKGVLDEKEIDGKTHYLVDWEEVNGESFPLEWRPKRDVTNVAIKEWEQEKRARHRRTQGLNEQLPEPEPDTSQESQPIQPAKRKRSIHTTGSAPGTPKRQRRTESIESEEPEPAALNPPEIPDSYEQGTTTSSHEGAKFRVEIPIPSENFDRDAYLRFVSSQPSTYTSSQPSLSSPIRPQHLYVGSDAIIPDSQDIPGSSSFIPSEVATYKTTPSTAQVPRPDSQQDTESTQIEDAQPGISNDEIEDSGEAYHREPGQRNHSVRELDLQHGPRDHRSPYADQSVGIPATQSEHQSPAFESPFVRSGLGDSQRSTQRSVTPSGTRLEEDKGVLTSPSPPTQGTSDHGIDRSSQQSQHSPQRTLLGPDTDIQGSAPLISENQSTEALPSDPKASTPSQLQLNRVSVPSPLLIQETSTREERLNSPQNQTELFSQPDFDQGFLTQLPLSSHQESNPITDNHVLDSVQPITNNELVQSHYQSIIVEETAPTVQQSSVPEAHSHTGTISSSESSWQAAQVRSPPPRLSTQYSTQEEEPQTSSNAATVHHSDFPLIDSEPSANYQPEAPSVGVSSSELSSQLKVAPTAISKRSLSPQFQGPVSDQVLESIELVTEATAAPIIQTEPPFEAYNSNLLSGPSSISSHNMDSQSMPSPSMPSPSIPKLSISEQLERAREKARAEGMANRNASIPSSVIPLSLAHPPAPLSQLSLREQSSAVPSIEADASQSPSRISETAGDTDDTQIPQLGDKEFIVPLPMVAWVRDEYRRHMANYHQEMKSFLEDEEIEQAVVDKMAQMIRELKSLSDHPSLIEESSFTQVAMTDRQQSRYAEDCSTKCLFLREFLSALQYFRVHVAVLARSKGMLDILEAICRFNQYEYRRPDLDTFSDETAIGDLKVTLLPATNYTAYAPVERLDLVIAFDEDFTREKLHELQGTEGMEQLYRKALHLITLKVVNSVEHLELCLPRDVGSLGKNIMLVNCIESTSHEVGILDRSRYPELVESARAVASFVTSKGQQAWPLPEMPHIDGIKEYLTLPQTLFDSSAPSNSVSAQSNSVSSQAITPLTGFKRPLGIEDITGTESPKRQKMTPPSHESYASPVDDSLNANKTEILPQPAEAVIADVEDIIAKTDLLENEQRAEIASLMEQISHLQIELESKGAIETQLRQQNNSFEARIKDHERSVQTILPKYQEALNERGQFQLEKERAVANAANLAKRLETRTMELSKLKEEKALSDTEIASARTALSSSSNPDVAEINKVKDELRTVQAENEKLKKKLASSQNEVDYMRTNYQQASSKATEMFQELSGLKGENETLQRKATDNLVLIHEIQQRSESAQLQQRISELESVLEERDRELEKKSEELRVRMNGRRETRGVSAPRSPRMGNGTMSPRPVERIIGNTRSRGSSPALGAGGFPGEGIFRGDALFQQGPSIGRWGHHLQ